MTSPFNCTLTTMQLVKFLARMENSRIVSFSQGRRLIACDKVLLNGGVVPSMMAEIKAGDTLKILQEEQFVVVI